MQERVPALFPYIAAEGGERERENFHDVGIWIRFIVPAPIVVPGQVLLDRNPGAPHRGHDTPVQLQAHAEVCLSVWSLWHAIGSALSLRHTPSEVCSR